MGSPNIYREMYSSPRYIASPYTSWLAVSSNPTGDSFSDWFRAESSRNQHYEGNLELKKQWETDSNGNPVFRYFDDKFFPVDGRGWGAEGQRDCYTNALRNYGYVAMYGQNMNAHICSISFLIQHRLLANRKNCMFYKSIKQTKHTKKSK